MNVRYIANALVEGDGQKYVKVDGEYIAFVSRSATGRLRNGDRVLVVIEEFEDPNHGLCRCADLPISRIPVSAKIEEYKK